MTDEPSLQIAASPKEMISELKQFSRTLGMRKQRWVSSRGRGLRNRSLKVKGLDSN